MDDYFFMQSAYTEALQAFENGETPVGCVITLGDAIIGRGANNRGNYKNALAHAELIAINQACSYVGDWRLENCRLYVTIEPCPMCAGAIIQARIPVLVYGADNPKAGCAGSILNIVNEPRFNHTCRVTAGVMREECANLMVDFFLRLRRAINCNPL